MSFASTFRRRMFEERDATGRARVLVGKRRCSPFTSRAASSSDDDADWADGARRRRRRVGRWQLSPPSSGVDAPPPSSGRSLAAVPAVVRGVDAPLPSSSSFPPVATVVLRTTGALAPRRGRRRRSPSSAVTPHALLSCPLDRRSYASLFLLPGWPPGRAARSVPTPATTPTLVARPPYPPRLALRGLRLRPFAGTAHCYVR